jgi:spermidine synthase
VPDRRRSPRAGRGPTPARRPRTPEPRPLAGTHSITTGEAELLADRDDPDGWILVVNGVPSSYVHLSDPTRLEFEYVRWIGDVLDLLDAPLEAPAPLRVAHLGGAGCTLARYVMATRPGSRQLVFEHDAKLVELVRQAFGLRRERGLRIRVDDARAGLSTLWDGSHDVVIRDAFVADKVPDHLTTLEFCREVARVLAPHGVYVANVADRTEQRHARAEAATLREVFREVALVAEPSQLRGRRYGNVLLIASNAPLPLDALTRRLASGAIRARVVPPERVAQLVAGLRPLTDPPAVTPDSSSEARDSSHERRDPSQQGQDSSRDEDRTFPESRATHHERFAG